jgi:hypothetical protein
MTCPYCIPYGMHGLVPVVLPRTDEELALPPEQRSPAVVLWMPCGRCIGGDNAGSEGSG